MNSPTVTFTTETDILDFVEQEPEIEVPALPLKTYTKEELDKKVLALQKEYETQKPTGIFF